MVREREQSALDDVGAGFDGAGVTSSGDLDPGDKPLPQDEVEIYDPWTGGALQLDPETNETTEASADPRSDEELAEEILNAVSDATSAATPDTIEAILAATAPLPDRVNLGVRNNRGQRPFQHLVSRISSNRFVEY